MWWMTRAESQARFGQVREMITELRVMMENTMANVSEELRQVAAGLRDDLGPAVGRLLSENAALRTRNAELEGEDAEESQAAADVLAEWSKVRDILEPVQDVPTPPETPGGEAPAE